MKIVKAMFLSACSDLMGILHFGIRIAMQLFIFFYLAFTEVWGSIGNDDDAYELN